MDIIYQENIKKCELIQLRFILYVVFYFFYKNKNQRFVFLKEKKNVILSET